MKKTLLIIMALAGLFLSASEAYAYDIVVDNSSGVTIYYSYINDGKELEVSSGDRHYSGTVVIPEEVTYMDKVLKVTSVGNNAFRHCVSLTTVVIPNSVKTIGYSAFEGCGITSMTIPNSVTSIGSHAFLDCLNLTSLTISNSITKINYSTFEGCISLGSVIIPNSVTSIEESAFEECWNLASVTIPNSVTHIGDNAFLGCSNLVSVTIPENVTTINDGAFWCCSNLKTLILPDNLKVIGKHAFAGSIYLTELVIPKNVELINEEAFSALFGLQKITVLATTPPNAYDNTFSNYDVPLYVPEEAINDYQATNPWNKFISEQTTTDAKQIQADVLIQAEGGEISSDGYTYDLQGRSMVEGKPLQPGIYVKDGRKFVVK